MIILLGCVAQPYELLQQHKFQLNTCFGVLPHRQFSAGMFIRGLPVHGCSVGNSPLGATSDQSPVNLQLIGGAHELTNQSCLSSSGRISANFNALLSEATKSTQALSEKPNQKVQKNGCWLWPTFETPQFQPKCLLGHE